MISGSGLIRAEKFRDQIDSVKVDWPLVRRVFSQFVPYWPLSLGVLGCLIASAALGLAPSYLIRVLIDKVLRHPTPSRLLILGADWLWAALLAGLVGVAQSYLSNRISQAIMADMRNKLFANLVDQSLAFYTKTKTGEVISRMMADTAAVQGVVSDTIFNLVSSALVVVVTIAFMLSLDWRLTVTSIIVLPFFVIPTQRVGNATFRASRRAQIKIAEMNNYLAEILGVSGMQLVHGFARADDERERFSDHVSELASLNMRRQMIGRWFFMFLGFFGAIGPVLIIVVGGYLLLHNTGTSVGVVIIFATQLLPRLYSPVSQFASTHVAVIGSLGVFQRIFEYMDLRTDLAESPSATPLRTGPGEVELAIVTFAYGGGAPVLRGASLNIPAKRLTALVGPSGAGKTTITSLVPRFYDPQMGTVRIDGQNVRDVTLQSLRDAIGIVFQDTYLFHASIRDNLEYARPDATQEQIEEACRAAYIHDFITSLPEGYDTEVGARGHRLSGGEKQRLAIARAILKDPRILILDEATSNLDSESEHYIQAALKTLFRGRTSIVIAHRLSTVLAADQIVVVERGRIVEVGTHATLLPRGGLYTQLYERQFATDAPTRVQPIYTDAALLAAG